jgi:(p)ppGpp synthase/HD superfamily hydrolase
MTEQPDDLQLVRARAWVAARHGAQSYGTRLHTHHLDAVERILVETGCADGPMGYLWRIAAQCHDVVEDTDTAIQEVATQFGFFVAALVWAVSGFGRNRKERNADIYRKLLAFALAVILKIADRCANIEDAIEINSKKYLSMYVSEHESFRIAVAHFWDEVPIALRLRLERAYATAVEKLTALEAAA